MKHDIELHIEDKDVYLTATYECRIQAIPNSDDTGRKWRDAKTLDTTLIHVTLYLSDDNDEIDWHYGENKPREISGALDIYGARLEDMLADEIQQLVNNPSFGKDNNA